MKVVFVALPQLGLARPARLGDNSHQAARQVATTTAKLAISLLAAWLIVRRLGVADPWDSLAAASPAALARAFAAFLLIPLLGGLRWWMALRGLGCRAELGKVSLLFSVACVVGHVLPTVAGDGFRLLLAVRQGHPVRATVGSVLAERAAMVLTLLLLVAVTAPAFASLVGEPRHVVLAISLFGGAAATCTALLAADRAPVALVRWPRWAALSVAAAEARRLMLSRWGAALAACSLVSNLNFAVAAFLLACALSAPATLPDMLVVVPPVMLVAALPVSFGGWGVREGALVVLLGHCGVPTAQALALALLFGAGSLLSGVPGLVLWACRPRRAVSPR